jgi:hypothetical protein
MNDIAKAIATSAVWISTAITLAFGLFKMNFEGGGAILVMLASTTLLAAAFSTAKIWKG